eukprot:07179_6
MNQKQKILNWKHLYPNLLDFHFYPCPQRGVLQKTGTCFYKVNGKEYLLFRNARGTGFLLLKNKLRILIFALQKKYLLKVQLIRITFHKFKFVCCFH